jgi:L-alanine-DL-glutamate epimerase-like enolase superfamily enzyme
MMQTIERQVAHALELGYRAIKICVIFTDLATDRNIVDAVREGRRMLGSDIPLMIDFGYRWRDWADAKWVLDRVADCDLYFAEATLQHDDLHGHAKLAQHCPMRICGAELAATRWEVREWIETAKVAVVQPDINHCGGLTEIRRICDMAELYGVQVIPHGWKTGLTAAAGRHFHAACPNAPMIEYVAPELYDLPLRRDLVGPEPAVRDGHMPLPDRPGLGVTLNEEALARHRID